MKKSVIVFILLIPAALSFAQIAPRAEKGVEISFTFTRQSGIASNQFAVWVEDDKGNHVKTLYVTRFTAAKGWKTRPDSLPGWTKASGMAAGGKGSADAASGATPKTGTVKYVWDYTGENGRRVSGGNYVVKIEGSTRWKNRIEYAARIGKDDRVEIERKVLGDNETENAMIGDVVVRKLK